MASLLDPAQINSEAILHLVNNDRLRFLTTKYNQTFQNSQVENSSLNNEPSTSQAPRSQSQNYSVSILKSC